MTECCLRNFGFRRGYAKTVADTTMGDDGLMNGGAGSKQDQFFGVLWKKHGSSHQGGSASKWAKRFFVVRDSFLLYYGEAEQRIYTRRRHFNLHPKGIVPLGNCDIQPCSTEAAHPFALSISGTGLEFPMIVAADTEYDKGKWMDALQQATRITWSNAQLWDALVRQLENQGLQMAKEKQVYFDKLQLEAIALHDEKLRTEELERLNEELEKEKTKMELLANELREEYEKMKMELEYTIEELKSVEEIKQQLIKRTEELQKTLEVLEHEKMTTLTKLKDRESLVIMAPQEQLDPANLVSATQRLHSDLQAIEMKMQSLLRDKADAEKLLQENQDKEKLLEEERKAICEQAEELKESIKDLAAQNAITEVELKEEVYARLAAEKRLQNAEQTLTRLEKIILQQGVDGRDIEETKNEMMGDVKRLKGFFENLSTEAKLDSEKSVMVKNTIHARKSMVKRAKTMKFETLKRQRSRACRSGSYNALDSVTLSSASAAQVTVTMRVTSSPSGTRSRTAATEKAENIVDQTKVLMNDLFLPCIQEWCSFISVNLTSFKTFRATKRLLPVVFRLTCIQFAAKCIILCIVDLFVGDLVINHDSLNLSNS